MRKNFFRWVILGGCFILMAVPFSIVNTIHTLMIAPVIQAKGFSLSAFSFLFTLSAVVVAAGSPIVGKLLRVFPIRYMMAAGAALTGGGFMAYSMANTLPAFYGIAAVVAVGMALLTTIPISTMITHWFKDSSGTALGIAFAGAGTGTFFWMQFVSGILAAFGFAYTYLLLGGIILTVSLPIALLVAAKSPEEKYRLRQEAPQSRAVDIAAQKPAGVLKRPEFISFAVGLFLLGFSVSGVQIHVQSYLASLGYPLSHNANVGSILAIAALSSSIIGGVVFDRLAPAKALTLFSGCFVAAMAALLFAGRAGVPYFFAAVFGVSLCLPSLWPSYGVARILPDADYAAALGTANLFFVAGGALGPFFSGLMADSILGYRAAWVVYAVFCLGDLALFLYSLHCRSERMAKKLI